MHFLGHFGMESVLILTLLSEAVHWLETVQPPHMILIWFDLKDELNDFQMKINFTLYHCWWILSVIKWSSYNLNHCDRILYNIGSDLSYKSRFLLIIMRMVTNEYKHLKCSTIPIISIPLQTLNLSQEKSGKFLLFITMITK